MNGFKTNWKRKKRERGMHDFVQAMLFSNETFEIHSRQREWNLTSGFNWGQNDFNRNPLHVIQYSRDTARNLWSDKVSFLRSNNEMFNLWWCWRTWKGIWAVEWSLPKHARSNAQIVPCTEPTWSLKQTTTNFGFHQWGLKHRRFCWS